MTVQATDRLRAAVAGRPVHLPADTEVVTVALDDLVELLVEAGRRAEALGRLSDAARLSESFIARVARVPEDDLPLYRSVLDSLHKAMLDAGVPVAVDDLVAA